MSPERNIEFNDGFMKIDPTTWKDADFQCLNLTVDDPHQKIMFFHKNIAVGYNIVKIPILSWKNMN